MTHQCINNPNRLEAWIKSTLDPAKYDINLTSMLDVIPVLSSLSGIPPLSPILIRADIDVPIKNGKVEDISRLYSFKNSIEFCRDNSLKPVLFGHVGRKPQNTGKPIADALADLYNARIHFINNWFDNNSGAVTQSCQTTIAEANLGEIILLENTRKYEFECALWDVDLSSVGSLANELDQITVQVCKNISKNYIFDALASANPDWSSIVVPAYMANATIAQNILKEFKTYVVHARKAQAVIFSGLKMDKLDDLEQMLIQGNVELVLAGGALAMALIKGEISLNKNSPSNLLQLDENEIKAYSITLERIQQAIRILSIASEKGISLVLPVDFVLDDGTISEFIPPGRLQMDVGPKTILRFEKSLLDFLNSRSEKETIIFYNGVLGKFEDEQFENGTKQMMRLLKTVTEAGVSTYVGGGEGLLALQKYGEISWVTHAFTSGGTILKAMSGRVISYLSSLTKHAHEQKR